MVSGGGGGDVGVDGGNGVMGGVAGGIVEVGASNKDGIGNGGGIVVDGIVDSVMGGGKDLVFGFLFEAFFSFKERGELLFTLIIIYCSIYCFYYIFTNLYHRVVCKIIYIGGVCVVK